MEKVKYILSYVAVVAALYAVSACATMKTNSVAYYYKDSDEGAYRPQTHNIYAETILNNMANPTPNDPASIVAASKEPELHWY